ncbi:MAG: hypothetical protein WC533_03835 [Candidatus Pacearchaeota archaeon]
MAKLKFCLIIDTEDLLMFNQYHPRWRLFDKLKFKLNYLVRNLRYDKNGFQKIYELILSEKFPVSFMLVGSKFKPISNEKFIDWGYHSYSHKRLTTLSDGELNKEIKNIYKSVSFSAPMWMIEPDKNPSRIFKELEKQGYKIATYRGSDKDIIEKTHYYRIAPVVKKYGMKLVYSSASFHGGFSKDKIDRIKNQILQNSNKEGVYCLATHDFANKDMKNITDIINFVKKLEQEGKIEITNLKELANNHER